MSFSRPTLAAFSVALAALHRQPNPRSARSVRLELPDAPESAEDLAFLRKLFAEHRAFAATPRDVAAAIAAATSAREQEFARLQHAGLTLRQTQVVYWVAEGKRDAEIARILGCASRTVSKHVETVLAKFGVETRLAAAAAARAWLRSH